MYRLTFQIKALCAMRKEGCLAFVRPRVGGRCCLITSLSQNTIVIQTASSHLSYKAFGLMTFPPFCDCNLKSVSSHSWSERKWSWKSCKRSAIPGPHPSRYNGQTEQSIPQVLLGYCREREGQSHSIPTQDMNFACPEPSGLRKMLTEVTD